MSSMRAIRAMRLRGGHLGDSVSALVDGQLDPETAERLWHHAADCSECDRAIDAEWWVKRRMARSGDLPTPQSLVGSLQSLPAKADRLSGPRVILRRPRRYLVAGAGSVSAALVGFAALSGGLPSASGPSGDPSVPGDGSPSLVTPVAPGSEDQFMSVVFVPR
jgi:anti-sigma factor RsiW